MKRRWMLVGERPELKPNARCQDVVTMDLGEHDGDILAFAVVVDRKLGLMRYAVVPTSNRGTILSGLFSSAMSKVAVALYQDQARTLVHGTMERVYAEVQRPPGCTCRSRPGDHLGCIIHGREEASRDAGSEAPEHREEPPARLRAAEGEGLSEGEGGEDRERGQDEAGPAPDGEGGGSDPSPALRRPEVGRL